MNFFHLNPFSTDTVDKNTETAQHADIKEVMKTESGWDRVKKILEVDEFGSISPEINSVLQVGAMSMFVGAIYGGVINSRVAYLEFMKNNQATAFKSHLEAKQLLQDKVTVSFGKGAFKWGWRLTLFSTTFVGVSTLVSTYRGKTGIIDYGIAGCLSGAMYKFNLGPRGWLVGGGLGTALGLVCGGLTVGLLSLTGMTMEEARYWQYYWKRTRNDTFNQGVRNYLDSENFAVIKLHDEQIGESGKNINNLEKVSDNKADK